MQEVSPRHVLFEIEVGHDQIKPVLDNLQSLLGADRPHYLKPVPFHDATSHLGVRVTVFKVQYLANKPRMALRDFTAADGAFWRVWDVAPDKLHPATRSEDYLADYLEGWLVFESPDGSQKSRLYPVPARWNSATDAEPDGLLRQAAPVRGDRASPPHGRQAIEDDAEPVATEHARARTFRFPDGRYWSAAEWRGGPGGRTVLRFSSGARSLDLMECPNGWWLLTDTGLATLLAASFPRIVQSAAGSPQRRSGDVERR